MKLTAFEIESAINDCDWYRAIDLLVLHFASDGLVKQDVEKIIVERGRSINCIQIRKGRRIFSWQCGRGFSSYNYPVHYDKSVAVIYRADKISYI